MKTKCLIYCVKSNPYLYLPIGIKNYKSKYTTIRVKQSGLEELLLNDKIVAECEVETESNEQDDYALHITSLNILDKPLSLSECEKDFKGKPASHHWIGRLTDNYVDDNWSDLVCVQRAPANMCWVWYKGERYVLISIRPECVCKILNHENDIEIRRKVLKGMC